MAVRRSFISIALLAGMVVAAMSCRDASPLGVRTPGLLAGRSRDGGLVSCPQGYDSVTQVIGPEGGVLLVGVHQLWVDSLSLDVPVTITAVAPKGKLRWVRFQPEGLVFKPGFYATANGLTSGAALMTNYASCKIPAGSTVRIAQVDDAMSIIGYLSQINLPPYTSPNQYVGLLPHFSNYAVAW